MHPFALLFYLPLAGLASAQGSEIILGAYIFHRHGDRTAKLTPPVNLTDLGYAQVFASGDYYRSRYLSSSSTPLAGLSADLVVQSQLSVSAPADTVLQNSATGFLQGLYPPTSAATQTLRNGTSVSAPLDGYQLIPVSILSSSSGAESSAWLQASTGCANAVASSNQYFYTPEYTEILNSSMGFYQSLEPVISGTFDASGASYKNAYTIFDLVNVAQIHNATYPSSDLITPDVFDNLASLAATHEYNLAYNASSPIRGIAGMQLAAEVVQYLNATITSNGANKLGIQFGAYGTFSSFFGLADLVAADSLFYGIADYASSMVFELFTNASSSASTFPATEDLFVRFLFHNGSSSTSSPPVAYPLFGSDALSVSWADFSAGMEKFAVGTTEEWCVACGNITGSCAPYAGSSSSGDGSSSLTGQSRSGLSNVDAGVIGAFVTVGFFLIVGALMFLVGGLTLVSKKRLRQGQAAASGLKV